MAQLELSLAQLSPILSFLFSSSCDLDMLLPSKSSISSVAGMHIMDLFTDKLPYFLFASSLGLAVFSSLSPIAGLLELLLLLLQSVLFHDNLKIFPTQSLSSSKYLPWFLPDNNVVSDSLLQSS